MKFDSIIVGAGAAGLMCAIAAGKRGRKVGVLEHNARAGNKILISGGGRCNFTNRNASAANYCSSNPHFCKSALSRYSPQRFIELVEHHGIRYHEKKLGQLFCDFSSREILEMLLKECAAAKVTILTNHKVKSVVKVSNFAVDTNQGSLECESLVIATGGLSFPKLGATDFAYLLAKQFGLKVINPTPGLVPLIWNEKEFKHFVELSGLSLNVNIKCGAASFAESLLFTHRGLSGPVILQISNYLKAGEALAVDLLPTLSAQQFLLNERKSHKELKTVLTRFFPQRFANVWCTLNAPSKPLNHYSSAELQVIAAKLHNWTPQTKGSEGYAKAEVTLGGVDTSELSSKTMEARSTPGLFFIGECVDVTGWLGGYNFQWAWASGHAAGEFA